MANKKSKLLYNLAALILILGIIAALFARISYEDQANEIIGPDFIRSNGQNLLVHNKGNVYLLDSMGNTLSNVNLQSLGFKGKLADVQLIDKNLVLLGNQEDKKIYQCNISTNNCSVFADLSKHVKDFFKFHVDTATNTTFISDTDHHKILLHNNTNNKVSIISKPGDFKFPNQLYFNNNILYIADTNHHRVAAYTFTDNNLSNLVFEATAFTEHTTKSWPTAFTIDNKDNLWVLVNNGLLREAEIIKYDKYGKAINKVTPQGVTDLSFITFQEGSIFVTDQGNNNLLKIDSTSNKSHSFNSGELQNILAIQRQQKQMLRNNSMLMLAAIAIMFILAIFIAASSYKKEDEPVFPLRYERRKQLHKKLDKILWLKPNKDLHNKAKPIFVTLLIITILTGIVLAYVFFWIDTAPDQKFASIIKLIAILLSILLLILLLVYYTVRYTLKQRLGTDGYQILMTETPSRGFKVNPDNILYDNMQIAGPDTSITYKNLAGIYFCDEDQFRQYIQPLLNMYGKRVGYIRMFVHQLIHFHFIAYLNLLLIIISLSLLYFVTKF